MNASARRLLSVLVAVLAILVQSQARALDPPTLITMDDLPAQPINGLGHPKGVTFGFTVAGVPNVEARYNSGGPGQTAYIEDPSIEGPAFQAVVSLTFIKPVTTVDFGLAMSDITPRPVGAVVQLFDPASVLLSSSQLALAPLGSIFIEGHYSYSGLPVRRAVVTLQPGQAGLRFAMDNLEFTAVPEPSTGALMISVLVATSGRIARRGTRLVPVRRNA